MSGNGMKADLRRYGKFCIPVYGPVLAAGLFFGKMNAKLILRAHDPIIGEAGAGSVVTLVEAGGIEVRTR